MLNHTRTISSVAAAAALCAAPAAGLAGLSGPHRHGHGHRHGHSQLHGNAKYCTTTAHGVGYQVRGTLAGYTADDAATPAGEATITLKVTAANHHAATSGAIADQNAVRPGVQVKGATLAVAATDAFVLKLDGYAGTDAPSAGDRVMVRGTIELTKRACAPAGTSTADRYLDPDVKQVTVADRDLDA